MTPAVIDQIDHCHGTTKDVWLTSPRRLGLEKPDLKARMQSAGHVIGNHTSTHRLLSRDGPAKILDSIDNGTRADGNPLLLRPPFGTRPKCDCRRRHPDARPRQAHRPRTAEDH